MGFQSIRVAALLAFVGAWSQMGREDDAKKKIRNRRLLFWLKILAMAYGILFCGSLLGQFGFVNRYFPFSYYVFTFEYFVYSFAAAFVLWFIGVWPAGDFKLFGLLSLFGPLICGAPIFRSWSYFLETLINIFIPAAVFVFLSAGVYLWRSRLVHQVSALKKMGPKNAGSYLVKKASRVFPHLRRSIFKTRKKLTIAVFFRLMSDWLISSLLIAFVCFLIPLGLGSPLLKSVFCLGLCLSLRKLSEMFRFGAFTSGVAVCGVCAYFLINAAYLRRFISTLGSVSLFTFCFSAGTRAAFKLVSGEIGYAVLPLIYSLSLFISRSGFEFQRSPVKNVLILSLFGLLYGFGIVFVRVWSAEEHQSLSAENLRAFMVPQKRFLEKLGEDRGFYETSFQKIYPDGLTESQALLLRRWCRERGIDRVPLEPTMPFAGWIFLGYFLTWTLGGSILRLAF